MLITDGMELLLIRWADLSPEYKRSVRMFSHWRSEACENFYRWRQAT